MLRPNRLLMMSWLAAGLAAGAMEVPQDLLQRLAAEEFRVREEAEQSLVAWGREKPAEAMEALYLQSRKAPEPEVRERCVSVLRALVGDEYQKDGEGYIGIRMMDELTQVPGDPQQRGAIRVIQIVPESAADAAGLKLNDLIVGLNELTWREVPVSKAFGDRIRQFKPETRVTLRVLREGKLLDVVVKLGRRPPMVDNPFMPETEEDLQAAEQAAREAYFQRWLERRKALDK
jgi:C-terminal processing protease CtpA/Prc